MKLAWGTRVAVDSIQYLGVVEMKASAFCFGFLVGFFFLSCYCLLSRGVPQLTESTHTALPCGVTQYGHLLLLS